LNKGNIFLPWKREELENILHDIISSGVESTKVDFKEELKINNREKGEFLKDISAIANSSDSRYNNFGFILIEVKSREIVGSTFLKENKNKIDNLQAQVDQLINEYISPFIQTHLMIFEERDKTWGVIIIPPSRMLPHVFIRDIDNKFRGDIYVRRGTTTEKAKPEDFARFFSIYIEDLRYEFQSQINNIYLNLGDIIKQNLEKIFQSKEEIIAEDKSDKIRILQKTKQFNLLEEIDSIFFSKENQVKEKLIKRAYNINQFFVSKFPWSISLPSDPVHSKEVSKKYLDSINKEAEIYWQSLAKLMLKDNEGKYNEAIINSIQIISDYRVPIGISINNLGLAIRYYPLVVSLYIAFIIGAYKKKDELLKKFSELKLKSNLSKRLISIFDALFWVRNAEIIFQVQHEQYPNMLWCDPIGSYIKLLFEQKINPYIDDYFFLINSNKYFYIGEFLLSLLPLTKNSDSPAPGIYLYESIFSADIIEEFLLNEQEWIENFLNQPLKHVLQNFIEIVEKIKPPNPECLIKRRSLIDKIKKLLPYLKSSHYLKKTQAKS
jgi:hypothetical protein